METAVRLGAFAGMFVFLAILEGMRPKRELNFSKFRRWTVNLGLTAINAVLLRVLFGAALIHVSLVVREHGMGILSLVPSPPWAVFLTGFVMLDLFMFLFHLLAHAVPLFWRLHRVHHSDLDFDVTTGSRFHPLEMLLSAVFKMGMIVLVGPMPLTVLAFELSLSLGALFSHANVSIPEKLDRVLRWVIVTPDMHRVHHSVLREETNTNFGFFLSIWDRIFLTYRESPARGHQNMGIGIPEFREENEVCFSELLAMPLAEELERDYQQMVDQFS